MNNNHTTCSLTSSIRYKTQLRKIHTRYSTKIMGGYRMDLHSYMGMLKGCNLFTEKLTARECRFIFLEAHVR